MKKLILAVLSVIAFSGSVSAGSIIINAPTGGGGGSGTAITTSTFANIGSCSTTAFDKKITSGFFSDAICNGASGMTYLWNNIPITPASQLPGLANTLQSGVTVSTTSGFSSMHLPVSGSATDSIQSWNIGVSTPYVKTLVMIPQAVSRSNTNYTLNSIGWIDGSGNTLFMQCGVGTGVTTGIWCRGINTGGQVFTAFNMFELSNVENYALPIVLSDDGTNLSIGVTLDGLTTSIVYSESRTAAFPSGPTKFFFGGSHSSADSAGNLVLVGTY